MLLGLDDDGLPDVIAFPDYDVGVIGSGGRRRRVLFSVPIVLGLLLSDGAIAGSAKLGGHGWRAQATQFEGKYGTRVTFTCPAGGTPGPLWGTAVYTDNSSVCTAAVNFGVIAYGSGGSVTIEMRPGKASYVGSRRNGTTSRAHGRWTGSFVVIGQPRFDAAVGFGGAGWAATATAFHGENGKRYLYICAEKGIPGRVYGTSLYAGASSVCTAALQAGLITLAGGGNVTIEIRPGATGYTGATRHGVTSKPHDAEESSFVFVDDPVALLKPAATLRPVRVGGGQTPTCSPHTDGWGQSFDDCMRAPGNPGDPTTYTRDIALEAAGAWMRANDQSGDLTRDWYGHLVPISTLYGPYDATCWVAGEGSVAAIAVTIIYNAANTRSMVRWVYQGTHAGWTGTDQLSPNGAGWDQAGCPGSPLNTWR